MNTSLSRRSTVRAYEASSQTSFSQNFPMTAAVPSWMKGKAALMMPTTPLVSNVKVARLRMGKGATGVVMPADVQLTKKYFTERAPFDQADTEAGAQDWEAVLKLPRWKMTRWKSLERARRFLLREEICYNLVGGGGGCVSQVTNSKCEAIF